MAAAELSDLRSIRAGLGQTQSQLAGLLGVSTRALQSYEQGWRAPPVSVQQRADLVLYLNWRLQGNWARPCWEKKSCPPATRRACPACQYKAGDLCWLVSGRQSTSGRESSLKAKLAQCVECAVMREWLPKP